MLEVMKMEKKELIDTSIALIKRELYSKNINEEDLIKRKLVLYNQVKVLSDYQKQDDVERKKLLVEILLWVYARCINVSSCARISSFNIEFNVLWYFP